MPISMILFTMAMLSPFLPIAKPVALRYRIVPVDIARPGDVRISAFNDAGQVIGWYDTKEGDNTTSHAFLWKKGKTTDLGMLPGDRGSRAVGINQKGQIVGDSLGAYDRPHAFLWERGHMRALDDMAHRSSANAINNRGQVVGGAMTGPGRWHVVVWEQGTKIDLGSLHPESRGMEGVLPLSINDNGQIVGISGDGCIWREAVLWQNGSWRTMGKGDYTQGAARAINGKGEIIGQLMLADNNWHMLLWQHDQPHELPFESKGINDRGQVVGQFQGKIFLYENGKTEDLNALLPEPREHPIQIVGINNKSQILCKDKKGVFMLVPVELLSDR